MQLIVQDAVLAVAVWGESGEQLPISLSSSRKMSAVMPSCHMPDVAMP